MYSNHQRKVAIQVGSYFGFDDKESIDEILKLCAWQQGQSGAFYQEVTDNKELFSEWIEEFHEYVYPSRD